MPYVDVQTIHNPATGSVAPAAWGDGVRDNLEFLIDPPACSIFESTAQSVANVTTVALTSNEEFYDNNGMHSTVTNTSRITAVTAGRYLAGGIARFAASGGGQYRQVGFRINGTTEYVTALYPPVTGGAVETTIGTSKTLVLAANDYVEFLVRHNSGGALNVTMDEFSLLYLTR